MATLQVLSAAEIPVTSALRRPTGPLTLFIHFVHLKSYFEFRHRKAADLELIAIPFHPLTKISRTLVLYFGVTTNQFFGQELSLCSAPGSALVSEEDFVFSLHTAHKTAPRGAPSPHDAPCLVLTLSPVPRLFTTRIRLSWAALLQGCN